MTHHKHSPRSAVPDRSGRSARRMPMLRQVVVLVAVLGVVAAACGRSDDTTADDAAGDDTSASASTPTTAATGPAAGEFGDLGRVCGPAPEGTTLEATDVGVTTGSIQIGTIADPGFAGRPGLNQEAFDSAEAFTKWCNEAGGVNGRKIDLRERDAKMTEHQGRMIDACDEGDFMLVGGLGIFDDQGQPERLACGLPAISSAVNPQAVEGDLMLSPLSNDTGTYQVGDMRWLGEQFPDATDKIGIMTAAYPVTITASERAKEGMASLGWKIVYEEQFNPAGEASWRGFAEGMKASGARGFVWTADPTNLAAVLKAMAEIGYSPDFVRAGEQHLRPHLPRGGRFGREQHVHHRDELPVPRSRDSGAEPCHAAVPGHHERVRPEREDRQHRCDGVLGVAALREGGESTAARTSHATASGRTPTRSRSGPAAASSPARISRVALCRRASCRSRSRTARGLSPTPTPTKACSTATRQTSSRCRATTARA